MDKKLPNIFANKVEKRAGNNENIFYSNHDERTQEEKPSVDNTTKKNINQKLNDIFNSSDYIYKADVEIKLKNENVTKRIVGRNSSHLITIDNELIPLGDIVDIKRK